MQDIISDIVNLLDGGITNVIEPQLRQVEPPQAVTTVLVAHPTATVHAPADASPFTHAGDDIRRFKQIVDLADNNGLEPYGNEPDEKYADIDAVTCDAGGGWQEPKHPSDIRVQHPSAYPGHQHNVGE